jgi:predicted dehydrogenase
MLRVAVIGTETETLPLITSAERLPRIECARVSGNSRIEDFAAVVCCGFHAGGMQAICDVASRGQHLLIDFAALTNIAEIDAVVAACRDANVRLMFAQPLRFLPSIQAIWQSLDAGELGEPGLLRVHRWVDDRGGELNQLLVREIDLANFLFGRPPETVYAVARENGESPRFVQVHLGFTDGGMAMIDISTCLPEGDNYYSLSLIGTDGSVYADDHHNMQLLYSGGPAVAERTGECPLHWTEPLREFAAAIDESRASAIGDDSARAALRVTAAVRRVIDLGNAMHWQGGSYEPA